MFCWVAMPVGVVQLVLLSVIIPSTFLSTTIFAAVAGTTASAAPQVLPVHYIHPYYTLSRSHLPPTKHTSLFMCIYIYVYAPNMASAGFDTSQSQRALQPLGHTDNKTCKRDGFFNPLLDTSDTSTIHVWKGQNGHSLSAYFLSWSSDSVVPQGKGLAGLVFKV